MVERMLSANDKEPATLSALNARCFYFNDQSGGRSQVLGSLDSSEKVPRDQALLSGKGPSPSNNSFYLGEELFSPDTSMTSGGGKGPGLTLSKGNMLLLSQSFINE